MQKSPQDIYARNLLSPRGYPLWTPEPSHQLLAYRRDGLRIGDVGVIIPEDGCFDVFFNLCLPHDHPFHQATGVPANFEPIRLTEMDLRTVTNAENPGRIIATSSVKTVATIERPVDSSRSSGQEYEFNLSSKEGALLILPEGAERHDLRNYHLFLEAAMRHGANWYHFAEEKVGQIIGHDSLYLITGLCKTLSWSLAAFEEAAGSEEYPAQCKLSRVGLGNITTTCTWSTTRALDWRIGPIDNFGIPNQAVFIRGFKIAQRTGMFGTRWISVKADAPSTRRNPVDYFGAVPGNSWLGYIFGGQLGSRNIGSPRSATQDEIAGDPAFDSARNEIQNHGALAVGKDVVIHRMPEASQAFHPSDIINQSLLNKEPSANIAITHDDAWIALLEKNLLQPEDLVQNDRLQALVFENHHVILEQGLGAVYMRSSNLVSHLGEATREYLAPSPSLTNASSSKSRQCEEVQESSFMVLGDRGKDREADTYGIMDEDHDHDIPSLGGLSALGARLRAQVTGDALDDEEGGGTRGGEDYFNKVSPGQTSVTSDRSAGAAGTIGRRTGVGGDNHERLRQEYEFRIATMQGRIASLERDLGNAEQRERDLQESQQRIRLLEEGINGFRKRAEEHRSATMVLQKELDELRDLRTREKEREMKRTQKDEEEFQMLQDHLERLEDERGDGLPRADTEIIELRSDMEGLMAELENLGHRNHGLMTAKDADLALIRDLDNQLNEYKRKYESAKTELRSVKATSQLYMQAPRMDDRMPKASDGGLVDIRVTAFVSGIDSLLAAGRTSAPTRVLMPMKAVVNSTSAIIEDIRKYELRPARANVDIDHLRSLCERLEATLSDLVAATKAHAMSSGMSPVSLLDAAASHVSATITEISRIICIRATCPEQGEFSVTAISQPPPSLRSIENLRSGDDSKSSAANSRSSSPPSIFDRSSIPGSVVSDDSALPEDTWSVLKPYLEAQTESIVYAIQSVLSSVRVPIPPPTLNKNLTQIITIVSNIVAACRANLPPTFMAQQGTETLKQLSEHAKKLQDVQTLPEVTKESRQIMAKSSFAIANAMKGLMKLGER